jgi:hypothetical protein
MLPLLLIQGRKCGDDLQLELAGGDVHREILLRQLWMCGDLKPESLLVWDWDTVECPNEKVLYESIRDT